MMFVFRCGSSFIPYCCINLICVISILRCLCSEIGLPRPYHHIAELLCRLVVPDNITYLQKCLVVDFVLRLSFYFCAFSIIRNMN